MTLCQVYNPECCGKPIANDHDWQTVADGDRDDLCWGLAANCEPPDVRVLLDRVAELETALREMREWANRMPDAGLTVDDPRYDWWIERPYSPAARAIAQEPPAEAGDR